MVHQNNIKFILSYFIIGKYFKENLNTIDILKGAERKQRELKSITLQKQDTSYYEKNVL